MDEEEGEGRSTATLLAGLLADVCVEGWGEVGGGRGRPLGFGRMSQRASCGSGQTLSYVDSARRKQ